MSTIVDLLIIWHIINPMKKTLSTKEKLLISARKLFWARGYSNVSVRDLTKDAGVDVALVSRYYDGKLGLFKASIDGAFDWPELFAASNGQFKDIVVAKLADSLEQTEENSAVKMLILNSMDPEVGDYVREAAKNYLIVPMQTMLGGTKAREQVALFLAVMIGASMMRNNLQVDGIANTSRLNYERQLRYLADAALNY
jgi:AcrR family transcriptional regulator